MKILTILAATAVAAAVSIPAVADERGNDGASKPKGESPERLVECLRAKGFEPPAVLEELKPWIERQFADDTGKRTLRACGLETPPKDKARVAPDDQAKRDCGEDTKEAATAQRQ